MMGLAMKLTLHPVTHGPQRNRYCGPSALSILTGLDTGRCAALLRRISGRCYIKRTGRHDMREALREMGIDSVGGMTPYSRDPGQPPLSRLPTLAQWAKRTRESRGQGTYLIVVGNHWAVVQGRQFACGWTGKTIPLGQAPKRRRRVTDVYSLVRLREVKVDEVVPPVVRKPDPERKARAEAQALIAQFNLNVDKPDRGDDLFWVYPPATVDGQPFPDPREDEHYAYGWGEVLDLAHEYAEAIRAFRSRVIPLGESGVVTSDRAICLDSVNQSAMVLA